MRILLFLLCALAAVYGRVWTLADGSTVEGEIYKASPNSIRLQTPEGRKVDVRIKDLSAADVAYLRAHYPEFFRERKGSKPTPTAVSVSSGIETDDASNAFAEESPVRAEWPKIRVDGENVGFRIDPKRGRFYTRHYRFDMKKKISVEDAKRLAHVCELTYESVRAFPFWPPQYIRTSAVGNAKFPIEVDKVDPGYSGVFRTAYNSEGEVSFEIVNVEPDYVARNLQDPNKPAYMGTLPHELCHQMLVKFGGSVALREGVAQYMQYAVRQGDTVAFIVHDKFPQREKPLAGPNLKKFLLLPDEDFHNSTRERDHYNLAYFVFNYFANEEPSNLRAFLLDVLAPRDLGEEAALVRTARAFPRLLNGRKQAEVEKLIVEYYAARGVQLKFR